VGAAGVLHSHFFPTPLTRDHPPRTDTVVAEAADKFDF